MQKSFYIVGFFLFFLWSGCQQYPYQSITVETDWGLEPIPGSCSAWTDKCNIYCRTGLKEYKKLDLENKCTAEKSNCIDDEPEKLKQCNKVCKYVKIAPNIDAEKLKQCNKEK